MSNPFLVETKIKKGQTAEKALRKLGFSPKQQQAILDKDYNRKFRKAAAKGVGGKEDWVSPTMPLTQPAVLVMPAKTPKEYKWLKFDYKSTVGHAGELIQQVASLEKELARLKPTSAVQIEQLRIREVLRKYEKGRKKLWDSCRRFTFDDTFEACGKLRKKFAELEKKERELWTLHHGLGDLKSETDRAIAPWVKDLQAKLKSVQKELQEVSQLAVEICRSVVALSKVMPPA